MIDLINSLSNAGVPSPKERCEILLALLSGMEHSLLVKDIDDLAMATHGFVGADLAALCTEAALVRLRQYVKSNFSHGDSGFSTVEASECQTSSQSQEANLDRGLETPSSSEESVNSNLCDLSTCNSETQNSSDSMDGVAVDGTRVLKDALTVTPEDFEKARIRIRPSAMREVNIPVLAV